MRRAYQKRPAKTKEKLILFMTDNDTVIHRFPFEQYEPGDIKEMREKIAEELNCKPKEIRIKITGV